MAKLVVRNAKSRIPSRLPHWISLNGRLLGMTHQAEISMPAGHYVLRIQSMIKWFSGTVEVDVSDDKSTIVEFEHNEFWWDMLFLLDLIAWIVQLFVLFENPWNIVYEVISNGAFIIWIIHQFRIRNKYYSFKFVEDV